MAAKAAAPGAFTLAREPECGPTAGPDHRQVHQALNGQPARQPSLDRRRDKGPARRKQETASFFSNGTFGLVSRMAMVAVVSSGMDGVQFIKQR